MSNDDIKGPSIRDRRRDERHQVNLEGAVRSIRHVPVMITDVGPRGLFAATSHELPVGSLVEVEIELPDSPHPLDALGEVRWYRRSEEADDSDPPGLGIELWTEHQELTRWLAS